MPFLEPPSAIPLGMPPAEPMNLGDAIEAYVDRALEQDGSLLRVDNEDGSVEWVEQNKGKRKQETLENWFRNIAEELDSMDLAAISTEVIEGVEADDRSREQWLNDQASIIDMLGLKLEEPKTSVTGDGGQLSGMSSVKSPLLLESVLRFQANARAELLPSDGPVKVAVESGGDTSSDTEAQDLEDALNNYLTNIATEYYPDTTRMLFATGYGGCGVKKVYRCPVRRRPVSESVNPSDFIVNNTATDLQNATRITHRIHMPKSTLKRMQLVKAYRNVELGNETFQQANAVDEARSEQQGITITTERPEDAPYELFEVYCELNVPGFEDEDKGKQTGLYLPWKVTVHKESRTILEIRRNWDQNDDLKRPREVFVKYTFVEGLGFYGIGLGHILGNTQRALTAMMRLGIDNAMFANFPGFLFSKQAGRQNTNEIRVPPGGGAPIDTGNMPIGNVVMPLPYKDLSPSFVQLEQAIEEGGQRLGGAAQLQVGEGKQDAPVGTTLALIEQATKIIDSVHKSLHASQSKEFQLLVDLFREDPMALWRGAKGMVEGWDESKILAALDRSDIAPKADPNTPSHMHRVMKASALVQLAQTSGGIIDMRAALEYALNIMGFGNNRQLLTPAPEGPPDPSATDQAALMVGQARMMDAQSKQQQTQINAQKVQADAMLKARQMQLDAAQSQVTQNAQWATPKQN